jgi:hypothetical protein
VDDALYVHPTHGRDWRRWLRHPRAFDDVLKVASLVLAGNPSVRQRAEDFDTQAVFLPTLPIEVPDERALSPLPTIVWTGSSSTLTSLEHVLEPVLRACESANGTLYVLGGRNVEKLPSHPRLVPRRWSQALETRILKQAWLGLMPLPDTPWEAGKSAYKLLLYMSAGVPAAVSPVGMTGMIAATAPGIATVKTADEWEQAVVDMLTNRDPVSEGEAARNWIASVFDRGDYLRWARDLVLCAGAGSAELHVTLAAGPRQPGW